MPSNILHADVHVAALHLMQKRLRGSDAKQVCLYDQLVSGRQTG